MTLTKPELTTVLNYNIQQLVSLINTLSLSADNTNTLLAINAELARINIILTNPSNL